MDRNSAAAALTAVKSWSLSARRAWIEIRHGTLNVRDLDVALRKESVDRNSVLLAMLNAIKGRSPQGERG